MEEQALKIGVKHDSLKGLLQRRMEISACSWKAPWLRETKLCLYAIDTDLIQREENYVARERYARAGKGRSLWDIFWYLINFKILFERWRILLSVESLLPNTQNSWGHETRNQFRSFMWMTKGLSTWALPAASQRVHTQKSGTGSRGRAPILRFEWPKWYLTSVSNTCTWSTVLACSTVLGLSKTKQ